MRKLQEATSALEPLDPALGASAVPAEGPGDAGILLSNIDEFKGEIIALQTSPPQADDSGVREATRKGAVLMTNLGDQAILQAAECDLGAKGPLRALLDLRERAGRLEGEEGGGGDEESDLGYVLRTLREAVDGMISSFGGEGEVAFKREDDAMLAHVKTYIDDVVEELGRRRGLARLASDELDRREAELVGKIKEKSLELSQQAYRPRGKLQRERIELMQSLVEFYASKVTSAASRADEACEFLGQKQEELTECLRQENKNYETMQNCHEEFAEMLQTQRRRLNDFVTNKEKQHRRDVKLGRFRRMALKYLQRHHALSAGQSLEMFLRTSVELSEAGVLQDEKRIAFEEATRVNEETLPRLETAERTNQSASSRLTSATKLLASFAEGLNRAQEVLRAKARREAEAAEGEAPKYGARCVEARGALRADVETMRAKLDELRKECSDDISRLNREVERLLMRSQDKNELYNQKKKELDECMEALKDFDEQKNWLDQVLDKSETEGVRLAEEAAQRGEQAVAEEAQAWLDRFHFASPRCSALPAVAEERPVEFDAVHHPSNAEGADLASSWSEVVPLSGDDDGATVLTADNFEVIDVTASTETGGGGGGSSATAATASSSPSPEETPSAAGEASGGYPAA